MELSRGNASKEKLFNFLLAYLGLFENTESVLPERETTNYGMPFNLHTY